MVCGSGPSISRSGSVGSAHQKTSRCSLIFNQTHVPTYAITTREGKAIATRRSHLRARIIAELYSKSGVIAYIEAFSIQSARIGASWAVGRLTGSYPETGLWGATARFWANGRPLGNALPQPLHLLRTAHRRNFAPRELTHYPAVKLATLERLLHVRREIGRLTGDNMPAPGAIHVNVDGAELAAHALALHDTPR